MDTYTVHFNDGIKFEFTHAQLDRIPYLYALRRSESRRDVPENDSRIFRIPRSSTGFELLHSYVTSDEPDRYFALPDNYKSVIEQCDFFQYYKLWVILGQQLGFGPMDATSAKTKGDTVHMVLKYMGRFCLEQVDYPILWENSDYGVDKPRFYGKYGDCLTDGTVHTDDDISKSLYRFSQLSIREDIRFAGAGPGSTVLWNPEKAVLAKYMQYFEIKSIHEPATFSSDPEINEIYLKRHQKLENIYFYKLLCEMYETNNIIAQIRTGKTKIIRDPHYPHSPKSVDEIVYELLQNVNPDDYPKVEKLYTPQLLSCKSEFMLKEISCERIPFYHRGSGMQWQDKYRTYLNGRPFNSSYRWIDGEQRECRSILECCRTNQCGRYRKTIEIYKMDES